jgi:hypothetical protein
VEGIRNVTSVEGGLLKGRLPRGEEAGSHGTESGSGSQDTSTALRQTKLSCFQNGWYGPLMVARHDGDLLQMFQILYKNL